MQCEVHVYIHACYIYQMVPQQLIITCIISVYDITYQQCKLQWYTSHYSATPSSPKNQYVNTLTLHIRDKGKLNWPTAKRNNYCWVRAFNLSRSSLATVTSHHLWTSCFCNIPLILAQELWLFFREAQATAVALIHLHSQSTWWDPQPCRLLGACSSIYRWQVSIYALTHTHAYVHYLMWKHSIITYIYTYIYSSKV